MKMFLMLIFISTFSNAAGLLQNEDFKTEAELISAGGVKSQLLNDSKIYVGAFAKTLDDAIADGDIGSVSTLQESYDEGTGTITVTDTKGRFQIENSNADPLSGDVFRVNNEFGGQIFNISNTFGMSLELGVEINKISDNASDIVAEVDTAAPTAGAVKRFTDTLSFTATNPNLMPNGNFDYWQRGTTQTTSAMDSADRWFFRRVGTTATTSRQNCSVFNNDSRPCKYRLQAAVTSVANAANFYRVEYRVPDIKRFSGRTLTFSVVMSQSSGTKSFAIEAFKYYGTGGTPTTDATISTSGALSATTNDTLFSYSFTVPDLSANTFGSNGNDSLGIHIWLDCGSNFSSRCATIGQQSGTWSIRGAKLEVGSTVTPFVLANLTLSEELKNLQTFFYKTNDPEDALKATSAAGWGSRARSNGTSDRLPAKFPVVMRSDPTITAYSYATGTNNRCRDATSTSDRTITIIENDRTGFTYDFSASVDGNSVICHYYADAETVYY